MLVHVRFFAVLRQQAGVSEYSLKCPAEMRVADAVREIRRRFPALEAYVDRSACAVNQAYVTGDTLLRDGDELALIPPVSGGTDDDWIDILAEPIDTAAVMRFIFTPHAGGINLFLGTTRAEMNSSGQKLIALDYEAYEEMARKQLHEMARQARKKWPIVRLAILHRAGRVGLGEPSVIIAVACPHRAEAFEACRWLIDMLKKETAIWKKEIWDGGEESWSGGG